MGITLKDFGLGTAKVLAGYGAGRVTGGKLGGLLGGAFAVSQAVRGKPLGSTAAIAAAGGLSLRPSAAAAERSAAAAGGLSQSYTISQQAGILFRQVGALPGQLKAGARAAGSVIGKGLSGIDKFVGAAGQSLFTANPRALTSIFKDAGPAVEGAVKFFSPAAADTPQGAPGGEVGAGALPEAEDAVKDSLGPAPGAPAWLPWGIAAAAVAVLALRMKGSRK